MPVSPTTARPTVALTVARRDARGFAVSETEHATIFAEPGVGDARAQDVGKQFEVAYRVVAQMLGVAEKKRTHMCTPPTIHSSAIW